MDLQARVQNMILTELDQHRVLDHTGGPELPDWNLIINRISHQVSRMLEVEVTNLVGDTYSTIGRIERGMEKILTEGCGEEVLGKDAQLAGYVASAALNCCRLSRKVLEQVKDGVSAANGGISEVTEVAEKVQREAARLVALGRTSLIRGSL